MTEKTVSILDAANQAWSQTADLESQAAKHSFTTQMWQKIRVKRESYEVDPTMFDSEFHPVLSLGAEVDGLTFCLTRNRELAVVIWSCAHKGCDQIVRAPFKDFRTLGKVLAEGDFMSGKEEKCQKHRSKLRAA